MKLRLRSGDRPSIMDLLELFDRPLSCRSPICQKNYHELASVVRALADSPHIKSISYAGEYRLNPFSSWTRPKFSINHRDGRSMKVGFTGMTTIHVFSKRKRGTHCYASEFRERAVKFIKGQ